MDQKVHRPEALFPPRQDSVTPVGQSAAVRGMPFISPETQQKEWRRHPHVHRVPPKGSVADDRTDSHVNHGRPHAFGVRASLEPTRMTELHRHFEFTRPLPQIVHELAPVMRREMRRQLDEAGAPFPAEGIETGQEIIRGADTIIESPVMADDGRKLGAETEIRRHALRPFRHPLRRVDAIMRGVEFDGPESRTVVHGPCPLWCLGRIHASPPWSNRPHGAPGPHLERCRSTVRNQPGSRFDMVWRKGEIHPGQDLVPFLFRNLAILHSDKENLDDHTPPDGRATTWATLVSMRVPGCTEWPRMIVTALEAAVLPRRCESCRNVLTQQEREWCGPCAFSWIRCPTDPRLRFNSPAQWAIGWSWLRNGPDRLESRLVHGLKYGVRPAVGLHLGRAMAHEWSLQHIQPDRWAVVPIPLHRSKQRQRGFNQSEVLARGWADITGMSLVDVLIRPRSGRSLTRLDRSQRIHRTSGLYAPKPSLPTKWDDDIAGCLLLDDVVTTGSTLEAAREALHSIWKGPIGFVTLLDAVH